MFIVPCFMKIVLFEIMLRLQLQVIEEGKFISEKKVEIYPVRLKLCKYANKEDTVVQKFSRATKIG